MNPVSSKFAVGVFVTIGIAVVIVLTIWLGASKVTKQGQRYLTYFDESVQGLSKDSQVKYRGVLVGRVVDINVAPDGKLVEVELEIIKKIEIGPDVITKLKPVGITGAMFIELDKLGPGISLPQLKLDFQPKYPVIPSVPSEISKIFRGIDEFLSDMRKLPLTEISKSLNDTISLVRERLQDIDIGQIGKETQNAIVKINKELDKKPITTLIKSIEEANTAFKATMEKLQSTTQNLGELTNSINRWVNDQDGELKIFISDLRRTTAELNNLVITLHETVQLTNSSLYSFTYDMNELVQEFEILLSKIKATIELIEEQPAQFFFGKGEGG